MTRLFMVESIYAEVYETHDARIRAEEAALEKLRQVKRGLMDDLLTGMVRAKITSDEEMHDMKDEDKSKDQ